MRTLKAVILKEFCHIIRDKKSLLVILLMPIVLVILFGFAIRTEIRDAKIAVLDSAHDELSTGLTNKLVSSGYFILDKSINSNSELKEVFADGDINIVIVFPPKFSESFYHDKVAPIQIIADASNLNTATTLLAYAQSIISDYNQELSQSSMQAPPFNTTIKMMYNPEQKDVYMFVPGVLALILMLVSAMMTAVSLAKEKETGTLRVLTISPVSTWVIIIGKVIPYLALSLLNTLVIMILSFYVLEMPLNGSVWVLALVCMVFLFTAMSMGVLISSVAQTQQIAMMVSIIGLYLPTVLLSGFIYPIENMPKVLQVICHIFPAKWFIEAIKNVMLKGGGLASVWVQLSVLVFTTALCIRISIKNYNRRAV